MIEGGVGYCGWRAFEDSGDASGWALDEVIRPFVITSMQFQTNDAGSEIIPIDDRGW